MRGKIKTFTRNQGGTVVTLETDSNPAELEKLFGSDLDIDLSVHREKRSLSANAYYHVICGKMAKCLNASMTEVCNRMIAEYGQMDNDIKTMIMRDDIPWERLETIHLRPTTKTRVLDDGKLYRVYLVMRGSHTYNTKEMSDLIHGVIQEAEQLGIQTMTPAEIEKLLGSWQPNE